MEDIQVTVVSIDNSFIYPGLKTHPIDLLRKMTVEKNRKEGQICNLMFQGQLLQDGKTLEEYGLCKSCCVRATFQSQRTSSQQPSEASTSERIHALMVNFRTCMRNYSAGYGRLDSLFKALSDTLKEVIEDYPDLLNDRVAYLMAQDSKLHRALLHKPLYITEALAKHPALLDALSEAMRRVTKTLTSSPSASIACPEGSLPVHYGMDYLIIDSQADDEDGEEGDDDSGDVDMDDPRAQYPASNPLSSNQLSSAIASALIRSRAAEAMDTQSPTSSAPAGQGGSQPRIRASDLMAAMSAVQSVPTAAPPPPPPAATAAPTAAVSGASGQQEGDPLRPKIQALAELGFTDEQAVRGALEIANGNVELAVNILLG